MTDLINKFISAVSCLPDWLYTTLARFITALVFWKSGQTKIEGFTLDWLSPISSFSLDFDKLSVLDKTFFLFKEEYNLPLISHTWAAYMGTFAEHLLPLMLIFGFGARFAALGLLIMTAVIQFFVYPAAYITHGLWAVALLAILIKGPGPLSIDHLIKKKFSN